MNHTHNQASLDNLQLFIAVADAGGFSRAADRLDLPVATLSRKIALLEKELNVPLFKRNTRNVSLTPAGEAFYAQLVPALDAVQSAVNDLSDAANSIQGVIRITTPADFARLSLAQPLTRFLQLNPHIKIELHLNPSRMDLIKEQIDVAILEPNRSDARPLHAELAERDALRAEVDCRRAHIKLRQLQRGILGAF